MIWFPHNPAPLLVTYEDFKSGGVANWRRKDFTGKETICQPEGQHPICTSAAEFPFDATGFNLQIYGSSQ